MLIGLAIGAVAGFIGGVLVGRRNKNKVEVSVAQAKAILKKAGIDV